MDKEENGFISVRLFIWQDDSALKYIDIKDENLFYNIISRTIKCSFKAFRYLIEIYIFSSFFFF